MPVGMNAPSGRRVEFSGLLTKNEVTQLATSENLETLQCSQAVPPENWDLLDRELFAVRPDVDLRVYGHYREPCDLSFVRRMGNLQGFLADCLQSATNVEAVADIPALRRLSIGISDLESFEFLDRVSVDLERLVLGETRSKKPSLRPVARFPKLREFFGVGHRKDLEALAACAELEKLVLSGITRPDLSFLGSLPELWWLEMNLGSADDLSQITAATHLKHLEISWTKKLSDLSFVSECISVQKLMLNRLRQVTELPDFSPMINLRALSLATMKGLTSVDPIANAPSLEWLGFGDASNFQPEDFEIALTAPLLRKATVGFGSDKRNKRFDALAASRGILTASTDQPFAYHPFEYR